MTIPEKKPSLPEVHRSIKVPNSKSFWRKMLAYTGPGYLVSVGYIDPGNWATDIAGGAKFGYTLLTVILLSNLMAILLQSLCVRLGDFWQRDIIGLQHKYHCDTNGTKTHVKHAAWSGCGRCRECGKHKAYGIATLRVESIN